MRAFRSLTRGPPSSLGSRRLARSTCERLGNISAEFRKALEINRERISTAIDGLHIDHLLPLMSYSVNVCRDKPFSYVPVLIDTTLQGLQKTELATPEQLADLTDLLSADTDILKSLFTEEQFVFMLSLLAKGCPLLNRFNKSRLLAAVERMKVGIAANGQEALQQAIEALLKIMDQLSCMGTQEYTREYMRALDLETYLKSEKQLNIEYDREIDCLHIMDDKERKLSIFGISQHEPVGQINNIRSFFEKEQNLDTLIIDQCPILDKKRYVKPDPTDQKMFEYSQALIKEWPYFYKFIGKPELRGYYLSAVFDQEYYEERADHLFYYRFSKDNKTLDLNNTVLAHFMGFGQRTASPSLYLTGLLPEERIIESTYRVDIEKAQKLNDLFDLYNIIGGLRIFQISELSGCEHCKGVGAGDNKLYFALIDRLHRGELESEKSGYIAAGIGFEAICKLKGGTGAVQVFQELLLPSSLRQLLENLRQQRLAEYKAESFSRPAHIKSIYNASLTYTEPKFYKKLALLENIMGTFETTLCLFIDLMHSEHNLIQYYEIRNQNSEQVLRDWNPTYTEKQVDYYCGAENVVLPAKQDDSVDGRVLYKVEGDNLKENHFTDKVKKRIEDVQQAAAAKKPEPRAATGRRIKMKPKDDWKLK